MTLSARLHSRKVNDLVWSVVLHGLSTVKIRDGIGKAFTGSQSVQPASHMPGVCDGS